MHSRFTILLLFALASGVGKSTFAQLCPELASSPVSPCPFDIETKLTKYVKTKTPLIIFTPLTELFAVNHTGKAIDVTRMKKHPHGIVGTVRGGVLGDDVYEYFKFRFFWNSDTTHGQYSYTTINGEEGTSLEALVYLFNRKYGTKEKALGHADGMIQISCRVNVIDTKPNLLYYSFEKTMKKIRRSNEKVHSLSGKTYYWFVLYPYHSTYYAYRGTYYDDDSGKHYPATTVVLPLIAANYISRAQYNESFGSLVDCTGRPMISHVQPQCPRGETVVMQAEGTIIKNLIG